MKRKSQWSVQKPNKSAKLTLSLEVPVKPWGNYLFDQQKDCRSAGLGVFALLSDEMIHNIILDAVFTPPYAIQEIKKAVQTISALAQTSKAFYVLLNHDALWRDLMIRCFGGSWGLFGSSWKETFARKLNPDAFPKWLMSPSQLNPFKVHNFYSDYLFASLQCAYIPLDKLCRIERNSLGEIDCSKDTIPRISNPSADEFRQKFAQPNLPCIITDVVTKWPAFKKWTTTTLNARFGNVTFRAESVDLPLQHYLHYLERCQGLHGGKMSEESPVYLFDKQFCTQCPEMEQEYQVPIYFQQDLFGLLEKRPDYRWLIIGPERSGSTFHVDPNSTSAWNAVITGYKKWILFPPHVQPPGIYVNKDQSEVTSPQSLTEWYLHYYDQLETLDPKDRPWIGICGPGEMMFVPNGSSLSYSFSIGWWHCVMNITESIAITQNYVDEFNLENVLRFLRDKPDQISGICCTELYPLFIAALKEKQPQLLDHVLQKGFEIEKKKVEETKWETLQQPGRFSFSFVEE